MLHLVGCLYYLYQWCTVTQISDNEIYLLIKYIKSVLWRVAKCLSYMQEARCLKVNRLHFFQFWLHNKKLNSTFFIIELTTCTNFSILFFFWIETLHVSGSSSVHNKEFSTVHTPMVCHTGLLWAGKLPADIYDIHHCCVYSGKLLMMDIGTVRNMYSFIPSINLRN